MESGKKRITVTVPPEKETEIEELKKGRFKEKSNSEMFRCLMQKGLDVSERRKSQS